MAFRPEDERFLVQKMGYGGSIQLTQHEKSLVFQKDDNPVGFVLESRANDGLGITRIRSRVEFLEGSFLIDRQPGHGTAAAIEVPVI